MGKKIANFLDELENFFSENTVSNIIFLIIDILLVVLIVYLIYRLIKPKIKLYKLGIFIGALFLIYGIGRILELKMFSNFLEFLGFWSMGLIIIVYSQDIKRIFESTFHSTNGNKEGYKTEEEKRKVINAIVNSASYLAERKIGALISIERIDNLDSIINKSILIKGVVTEELLSSLFFVGSPTHDGAVIVRGNKIMCAGAYLPSTDKFDVPKSLGTRHRAAIGISEKYDAITIIVSEETGKISLTIDGVIQIGLDKEKIIELLEQYLIVT